MLQEVDPILASLKDELRVMVIRLNELYHPVYEASPERIAPIEARVASLREMIEARRAELAEEADAAEAADAAAADVPTAD
jgi:hypothetical protein